VQVDAVDITGDVGKRQAIELNEFELAKVLITQHGGVVLYSPSDLMIYLFSVNGKLLCEMDAMERLHAWALTTDGECLITGSERMIVKLRCLDDLHTMHTFQPVDAPIHSLALTPEENILLVRNPFATAAAAALLAETVKTNGHGTESTTPLPLLPPVGWTRRWAIDNAQVRQRII
jgi:hypothetical protein